MDSIGVVAIGRNEGERLKKCIQSLAGLELNIVYVDSNSSDGSVDFVHAMGFDVVELDMSMPFSAARARNEGYRYLIKKYPSTQFVQFVDGDCIIADDWIEEASRHLSNNSKLAAVCGRRKELYPEKTLYNALCDIEWNTPIGIANATGGDFMCRKEALQEVNGFNPQVIAGEEPEMCYRLRQKGWQIERLDYDMTYHDANMRHFYEWWKRNERTGHAYAQGFHMYGKSAERYNFVDLARIVVWSLVIPLIIVVLAIWLSPSALFLFLVYPIKFIQLFFSNKHRFNLKVNTAYCFSLVLGKFPQLKGVLSFYKKLILGKQLQIIEYK